MDTAPYNNHSFLMPISCLFSVSNLSLITGISHSLTQLIRTCFFFSMTEVCCFCLGGTSDIPAFGTRDDARDFVNPCATCSIEAHRKCLLDWFNSLPEDKLQIIDRADLLEIIAGRRRVDEERVDPGTLRIDIHLSPSLIREWLYRFVRMDSSDSDEENDEGTGTPGTNGNNRTRGTSENGTSGSPSGNASGHVNEDLSAAITSLALLHQQPGLLSEAEAPPDQNVTYLLAPCPQCKSDIVVSMTESALLTFVKSTKAMAMRTLSATVLCLGVTSAVTGVMSLGYVGLTTCGLKTMEALVPGRLLVSMLRRPGIGLPFQNTSAMSGPLESAISSGIIDPFKFLRIPILPVVLFRMRSSSILSVLAQDSNWFTEMMVAAYLSSLGNNELVLNIGRLLHTLLVQRLPYALIAAVKSLSISLLTAPTLISLLVPLRWAYDLFFRLTFNRLHFNVALRTRPREIANSISEPRLERLEDLSREMAQLWDQASKMRPKSRNLSQWCGYVKSLALSDIPKKYLVLWLSFWIEETRSCLQYDYLHTFLVKSLMLRVITTVAWPFLGARVGRVIFKLIASRLASKLEPDTIMVLANIMGLFGVALLKDTFNLFIATQKARQLRQMGWVAWSR